MQLRASRSRAGVMPASVVERTIDLPVFDFDWLSRVWDGLWCPQCGYIVERAEKVGDNYAVYACSGRHRWGSMLPPDGRVVLMSSPPRIVPIDGAAAPC